MVCKARPISVALQALLEDKLDHLQHQSILKPTQHTKWATPLVLVQKTDGTLNVCGDYRRIVNTVTVKAAVKKASYPLPTTDEVFANLHGGTLFSMLDLYQAYLLLKVDEETAAQLTVSTKRLFGVECLPF